MTTDILFVDDEPDILQGLRRSMKRNRKRFDMRFVGGGAEALDALVEHPADIVISDMRMPGMDGGELLSEVRNRFPGTVRMILSGYAEREAVMRTVGPAHQYLSKPCDAETLCAAVDRALALQGLLESPSLRSFVTGLSSLPTLPESISALIDELESAEPSMDFVVETIAADVSMTAQIMKLSNSAYFATARTITSLQQAVQMLGFDTIKSLILVSGIFSLYPENPESEAIIRKLNNSCLSIGVLAKGLANMEGLDQPSVDLAGCAGVLSHVGTLALIHHDFPRFTEAVSLVENGNIDIATAEKKVFGASHAELGAYLLGLWGFANPIVEAVAYHHVPEKSSITEFDAVTAVYVAQTVSQAFSDGEEILPELEAKLDMDVLERAGVADRLPVWRKFFIREINKSRQQ